MPGFPTGWKPALPFFSSPSSASAFRYRRLCLRALLPIRALACDTSAQDRHLLSPSSTKVLRLIVWFAPARKERPAEPIAQTFALQSSNQLLRQHDSQDRFPLHVRRRLIRSLATARACFVRLLAGAGKSSPVRRPARDAPLDNRFSCLVRRQQNRMPT